LFEHITDSADYCNTRLPCFWLDLVVCWIWCCTTVVQLRLNWPGEAGSPGQTCLYFQLKLVTVFCALWMAEKRFILTGTLIGVLLSSAYADGRHLLGNMVPLPELYQPSSWDPDVEYTRLSAAVTYNEIVNIASQIKISYCNNYALNTGSISYTPCNAHYLVAAHSNGVILPPNMCGGQMCPIAGGSLGNSNDAQTCASLKDSSSGQPLAKGTTTLFDQYCLASQTPACGAPATPTTRPLYSLAPPVFTVSTNWCDNAAAGRTRAQYPSFESFLGVRGVPSNQFCPADMTGGYSNTPVRISCDFLGRILICRTYSIFF
jgi:hypothetical protein